LNCYDYIAYANTFKYGLKKEGREERKVEVARKQGQ